MILATGRVADRDLTILRGRWDLVALSIVLFIAFMAFIPVRLRRDWRSHGVYAAFVVSLFAEMFGFPLSIYFLSSALGLPLLEKDFMLYMYMFGMPIGSIVTFLGVVLVMLGWREVYRAKDQPARTGIYKYTRHPQYLGILLVAGGWAVHWPTVPSVGLWPLLVVLYYRLARREEAYLKERFGEEYSSYAERTPMLLPFRWGQRG